MAHMKDSGPKPMQPGDELAHGKYRVVRLIGRGGMGAIYEALNTHSGRRVAIKCLRPERANDAEAWERMRREAQVVAQLRHRNVVDVYDVHEDDDDTLFLVMEYLEGRTLRATLEGPRLPVHEVISLLLPAMRGVAAAHKRGYIHGDIKPENIFLSVELDELRPVPKVLDFGICKSRANDDESALTQGPTGTPLYMSLEQLQGKRDVDERADVYAFAVILYEALTGQRPYPATTAYELCAQVLLQEPIPPQTLRPELPSSLSQLVLWALHKDRDQRIKSLEQFIVELEAFSTARDVVRELAASQALLNSAPDVAERRAVMVAGVVTPARPTQPSAPSVSRSLAESGSCIQGSCENACDPRADAADSCDTDAGT